MSSISNIRESADVKLAKLDARADAFHAALEGNKDGDGRIARNKQDVRRALDELTAGIAQQKELPDTRKQAISSMVDSLNKQIALIQTASREQVAYARRQIHDGIGKIETEIDTALAESHTATTSPLRAPIEAYARAVDKLDAELEAVELRFASVEDKVDAPFDQRRKEMAQEIVKFKQRLGEKNQRTGEKLADLEQKLRGEFEQTVRTIRNMFG
jgi:uncharacterized protein (DUF342 family)